MKPAALGLSLSSSFQPRRRSCLIRVRRHLLEPGLDRGPCARPLTVGCPPFAESAPARRDGPLPKPPANAGRVGLLAVQPSLPRRL